MAKHKLLGQVFSLKNSVEILLASVGDNRNQILNKSVIKTANSEGFFLLKILKRLLLVGKQNNLSDTENVFGKEKFIFGRESFRNPHFKIYDQVAHLFHQKPLRYSDFIVGNRMLIGANILGTPNKVRQNDGNTFFETEDQNLISKVFREYIILNSILQSISIKSFNIFSKHKTN